MHDLAPLTPLGADTARVDVFDGLEIAERPDIDLAMICARRGAGDRLEKSARALFPAALPGPGGASFAAPYTAFWLGPQRWMIEAEGAGAGLDLEARLVDAFGDSAAVSAQGGGWLRLDISGARSLDALERLVMVDARAMDSGAATPLRLEHLRCQLLCRAAGARFSLYAPRSAAGSVHHALTTAAGALPPRPAAPAHISG